MTVTFKGLSFENCKLSMGNLERAIRKTEWPNEDGQNLADEGLREQQLKIKFPASFSNAKTIDATNDGRPGTLVFDGVSWFAARISTLNISENKFYFNNILSVMVDITFDVLSPLR